MTATIINLFEFFGQINTFFEAVEVLSFGLGLGFGVRLLAD
jgi:hypothetical protein